MAERYPDPFEAYLLLDYNNRLSVGRWISIDEENREGIFRQGHCGVYEKDEIIAWIPIEEYKLSKGDRIVFVMIICKEQTYLMRNNNNGINLPTFYH